MRRVSFFVGSIALFFSHALAAQDGSEVAMKRTPASAQQFLASEIPAYVNPVKYGSYEHELVTEIASDSVCRTRYLITHEITRYVDPKNGALVAPSAMPSGMNWENRYVTDSSKQAFEKIIDWSKVRSVTVSEGKWKSIWIDVIAPGSPESSMSQLFGAHEQRDRVLAAMKFLQSACDVAAETGF